VPIPSTIAKSSPIIEMIFITVGPCPISVACFSGGPT
jgi:hypothetical protein